MSMSLSLSLSRSPWEKSIYLHIKSKWIEAHIEPFPRMEFHIEMKLSKSQCQLQQTK